MLGAVGACVVAAGWLSGASSGSSHPTASPVTHAVVVDGSPSPLQIAMALGTSNRVTGARLGRYGKDRAVVVGVRAHGIRATVEAAWSTYVTAAVFMHDCHAAGRSDCPKMFNETAPNGSSLQAGRLTLSHARFPSPRPGLGNVVARRVAAAGLHATSVKVDNVGVSVVIVQAVAADPAMAVRSKADERSVAVPGLAGTPFEIFDRGGHLVSISAICNLGQAGTGWTAPTYRALVPNQMAGVTG
jgi:hypothetical protein